MSLTTTLASGRGAEYLVEPADGEPRLLLPPGRSRAMLGGPLAKLKRLRPSPLTPREVDADMVGEIIHLIQHHASRPVGTVAFRIGSGAFRKLTALAWSADQTVLTVAKFADGIGAAETLRREADALAYLSERKTAGVPILLAKETWRGSDVLVEEVRTGPESSLFLRLPIKSFLKSMVGQTTVTLADTHFWEVTASYLDRGHPDSKVDELLDMLRHRLEAFARDTRVPVTIIHGDFSAWNLRLVQGRAEVFDWEMWYPEGPPLFDLFHFFSTQEAFLRIPSSIRRSRAVHGLGKALWPSAPEHAQTLYDLYLLGVGGLYAHANQLTPGAPPGPFDLWLKRELGRQLAS